MARLKITQVKSRIGSTERQCKNLDALGLKRINAERRARRFGDHKGYDCAREAPREDRGSSPAKKAAPRPSKPSQGGGCTGCRIINS
ncbi:MAG: uL30 family ribosomal protein [Alistipes shahii]